MRRLLRDSGLQAIELLVASAVALAATAAMLPSFERWSAGLRVSLAAREVAGVLRSARAHALRRGARAGVKFRTAENGRVTYAVYLDGNGNGVLSRDIESGVDPPLVPPQRLSHLGSRVGFGFPPGPAPRDPGDPRRRLGRLHDPIRFNRSDLASFNPLGGSTPGSLYLTDHRHHLFAVRLFGRTGKVKVIRYDRAAETWR